jgi:hypothetical protein
LKSGKTARRMKKSWRIWRCEKLGKGVYNYCEAVVEFLGFMVIINENEKKKKKKSRLHQSTQIFG